MEKLIKSTPLIATVVIPLVLAFIGNQYTSAIKNREVEAKFVALAVDILKQEPSEENRNVREWATKILDKYSGVELSDQARIDLITTTSAGGIAWEHEIASDYDLKDSELNVDMNGGPVTVTVDFELGNTGNYYHGVAVDGDLSLYANDGPLVFSPADIKQRTKITGSEHSSFFQFAPNIERVEPNKSYRLAVIFSQDNKILWRETVEGNFPTPLSGLLPRSLQIQLNEVE